jgi:hypothetical protein
MGPLVGTFETSTDVRYGRFRGKADVSEQTAEIGGQNRRRNDKSLHTSSWDCITYKLLDHYRGAHSDRPGARTGKAQNERTFFRFASLVRYCSGSYCHEVREASRDLPTSLEPS